MSRQPELYGGPVPARFCPERDEELTCIRELDHSGLHWSGELHFTSNMKPPARRGRKKQ